MKNILPLFISTLLILNIRSAYAQTTTNPAGYCVGAYTLDGCGAGPTGGTNDFVHTFTFNTISNINSFCTPNPYYIRYLPSGNFTTRVVQGQTVSMTVSGWSTKVNGFAVWIDFNQNLNFNDPGEMVYTTTTLSGAGFLYTASITIPLTALNGDTRLRVRSNWNNFSGVFASTDACVTKADWGETEDYTITIGAPPTPIPPLANFDFTLGQDTIWQNTPSTLVNISSGADRNYWDITGYNPTTPSGTWTPVSITGARQCLNVNMCGIDTLSNPVNFRYTFTQAGYYRVRLSCLNQFGTSFMEKAIFVSAPLRKPKAQFFADRRILGVYDQVQLYDLTTNGPSFWQWYMDPPCT
ncbi:MAG: GEVED domain-containing protein, partial [Bacteroidota bacterium]